MYVPWRPKLVGLRPQQYWARMDTYFNQHVIDYLMWQIAERQGVDHARPTRRSMAEITAEVLKAHVGVTLEDVKGKCRKRHIVAARQAAMYFIRKERPSLSFPEIGRFFGGRDHTTVLHAVRKLEAIHGEIQH